MSAYLQPTASLDLSVVVPMYNERDNVAPLAEDILREVGKLDLSFELILVNDGSSDGTGEALDAVASRHSEVRVIHFTGNRGQTIAIAAGMYRSAGRIIVLMDGDRQNDPSDIGRMISKLNEGYQCVSGWRKDRRDSDTTLGNAWRRLPSQVANWMINRITGVPVHDLGCTLKAYTRDALDPTELFGEMHRFLAVYVQSRGGRIAEMVVKHHPRAAGESKYGLSRTARVMADMLLIRILHKYRSRPSHMFAKVAQWLFVGSSAFGLWWLFDAVWHRSIVHGAVPFLSALMLGTSAILVLVGGLVCELVVRNRYAMMGQHPWEISRTVNWDERGAAVADVGTGSS